MAKSADCCEPAHRYQLGHCAYRPGSGGGTTIYRIINYLQANGYRNRVYFYDVYGADHQYFADVASNHFGFTGPVGRVQDGMRDAHAVVATAWATAYPAFNAKCAGKRFYFVQDYEPWFHPVGAASILAENTYKMRFYGITAGRWLTQKLDRDFGMAADYFDFGCDTAVYRRLSTSERKGVVFYARPGAARRGFELGLMAMRAFADRRPEVPLHFYGERMGDLPFRFVDHGKVTPAELNVIYNSCRAGLSLSMTNVSLVPHEMLAAGCIPVVNEGEQNRVVLDNPFVRYAAADPHSIAATIEAIIDAADFETVSLEASAKAQSATWNDAGEKVDRILRRELAGHS